MEQDPIQLMLARQVELSNRQRGVFGDSLPRYFLRRLFATTAMAVGIGLLIDLFGDMDSTSLRPWAALGLWFGGGALIGAGFFGFFQHPVIGAVVGFLIATALVSVIALVIAAEYPQPSNGGSIFASQVRHVLIWSMPAAALAVAIGAVMLILSWFTKP